MWLMAVVCDLTMLLPDCHRVRDGVWCFLPFHCLDSDLPALLHITIDGMMAFRRCGSLILESE